MAGCNGHGNEHHKIMVIRWIAEQRIVSELKLLYFELDF
jgi:hypothetical protein